MSPSRDRTIDWSLRHLEPHARGPLTGHAPPGGVLHRIVGAAGVSGTKETHRKHRQRLRRELEVEGASPPWPVVTDQSILRKMTEA